MERQDLQDAEDVEADISGPSGEPTAETYELTNRALPPKDQKASQEQKARITQLLDQADVDDATRERVAGAAGRKDYLAADAETEIARLEALVPKGDFSLESEG
jgi:hypothetical protein